MVVKVKYLRDIGPLVKKGDWIDLRCAERTVMRSGDFKLIPLGVAMELPEGYEAIVVPRSSTYKKYGIILAGSIGVIDEDYNGDEDEWWFPAVAFQTTIIERNERIAQFRIVKHQPEFDLDTVVTLGNSNRGGIGSTGRL